MGIVKGQASNLNTYERPPTCLVVSSNYYFQDHTFARYHVTRSDCIGIQGSNSPRPLSMMLLTGKSRAVFNALK